MRLLGTISRRVVVAGVLLVAITSLVFLLLSFAPDPSPALVGEDATDAQIQAMRDQLGLNQPLLERYGAWISGAFRGDFGASWFTGKPVSEMVVTALPVTLSIAIVATIVSAVIGIAVGMTAAVRGGWLDKALQTVLGLGFSLPAMWVALVLIVVFAVTLRWLPATGFVPLTENPIDWLRYLTLPVLAIVTSEIASIGQQIRSDTRTLLAQEWYRTLRSRGLPARSRLFKHLMRNAAPTTLTIVGLHFITLLSGAIILERIFALPGLGRVASDATLRTDVPVVLGVVVMGTIIVLVVNLVVDLTSAWLNPKERTAA